jgi:pimeloyl-ACP methyl ester carboxylesterase
MEFILLRLVIGAVALYGAAVGYMSVRETALVYPGMGRTFRMVPSREAGFRWDTLRVTAPDSVPVLLLETRVDTSSRRPWVLYLHGNLGLLGARGNVARYQLLREAGFNVLAVEYRGFGASASAGRPSEQGINADAAAGWTHLTGTLGVSPDRVLIYGYSLGGGPATFLAAQHPAAALVTEGVATSIEDVGAARYRWLPVKLIMRNEFRNIERVPALNLPWVIFHGRNDVHVPFSHGEALAAAKPSALFVPLNADHDGGVIEDRRTALPALRDLARRIASPVADAP